LVQNHKNVHKIVAVNKKMGSSIPE
jgi:hypothetical protein